MAYYINSTPTGTGNYGNPMGQPFVGSVALPDGLLSDYIEARGFVIPTIENGSVVSLEANQEALEAYRAERPEQPEAELEPTEMELAQQDITDLQLNDIEQGQQMTDLELAILGGGTGV